VQQRDLVMIMSLKEILNVVKKPLGGVVYRDPVDTEADLIHCGYFKEDPRAAQKRTINRATVQNGEKVREMFPWMVQIWAYSDKSKKGPSFMCGGSLISKKHVLTAFHCVEPMEKFGLNFTAVLAGICLISPEEIPWKHKFGYKIKFKRDWYAPSKCVFKDSDFDSHDIAIMELENEVDFSNGQDGRNAVSPICLPKSGEEFYGEGTGLGWGMGDGHKTDNNDLNIWLKKADLQVSSNKTFQYTKMFTTKVDYVYNDKGRPQCKDGCKDMCAGDSGGPLMRRDPKRDAFVIVGTVSGGGWDCHGRGEGIAMPWGKDNEIMDQRWNKVSAHMDWITAILKDGKGDTCKVSPPKKEEENKIASKH